MDNHKLTESTICAMHDVVSVLSINYVERKQLLIERKQFSFGKPTVNSQSYVNLSIKCRWNV